jgi:hypothetical protein
VNVARGVRIRAFTWAVSCFTSGIARLPAPTAASPRAVKSIASWRQAATIGPTAAVGTMPQAACAWASAASKSSMPCTRCASLNQSVSGLLRSIGVNKLILAP